VIAAYGKYASRRCRRFLAVITRDSRAPNGGISQAQLASEAFPKASVLEDFCERIKLEMLAEGGGAEGSLLFFPYHKGPETQGA